MPEINQGAARNALEVLKSKQQSGLLATLSDALQKRIETDALERATNALGKRKRSESNSGDKEIAAVLLEDIFGVNFQQHLVDSDQADWRWRLMADEGLFSRWARVTLFSAIATYHCTQQTA